MALIGAVVLVAQLRPAPTSVRRLRVWLADADRLAIGFVVLAGIASVFVLSVAFFSRHVYRGEFFIYGRHNEGFMPLLVAAAAVFMIGPARRSLRVGAAVRAAVGTALLGSLLAVHYRDGELQRNVIHLSIPRGWAGFGVPHCSSTPPRPPSSRWQPSRPCPPRGRRDDGGRCSSSSWRGGSCS